MGAMFFSLLLGATLTAAFEPLHHLGGNSPWFSGPNVFEVPSGLPLGCHIDQAAFVSRHASRYPDPSAYFQWTNLSAKIHTNSFATKAPELAFLHTWQPVLDDPANELSLVSPGGYRELNAMGTYYRHEYQDLLEKNEHFSLWANRYQTGQPRVIDSARAFARSYLADDASGGQVLVLNNSDPRSFGNSLAPSDLCPSYSDNSGGSNATTWADIYLPPIVDRINHKLDGLSFNSSDVLIFPYLCGFETQITGRRSPWCDVFTNEEILQYEYAQDIRYWYGSGLGSAVGADMMLPFLTDLVQRFVDGPEATYKTSNSSKCARGSDFHPNKLIAAFTNDGQVNQLAASIGVFDDQAPLPATEIPAHRTFKASHFVTMRGTVGFERLNCGAEGLFLKIKLNGQIYPVSNCQTGPDRSCPLPDYQKLVAGKSASSGSFAQVCGVANSSATAGGKTTFLHDPNLPFEYAVSP